MPSFLDGNHNFYTSGNGVKTNTALADAAADITATQLQGGEFTITPTVARILTLPTALLIIAEAGWTTENANYEIVVVNTAAFDVTLAAGVGVTIVGRAVINNGSATWRVRRLTSTTVEVKRLEGADIVAAFAGTNQSLAGNGYQRLPGGLIIQWGSYSSAANTRTTITLPIAFPNVNASVAAGSAEDNTAGEATNAYAKTLSTISIVMGAGTTQTVQWMAIGY